MKTEEAQTTSQKPGPARAAGGLSGNKPPACGDGSQSDHVNEVRECADNAGESPERLAPLADTDGRDTEAEHDRTPRQTTPRQTRPATGARGPRTSTVAV